MAERPKYQFKSVQLLKDQSLGIGSYGAVCKAKCDDLLCAAKIIHPTLFDPIALQQIAPQREHRLPIRRFEQECEFMSAIRHPNIVQYLGTFKDTVTRLPVLLMELMDDSLTHFLESATQPIPYHIQVNICHDVTLALSFLHSNKIVHRDLSSNNVLLIGNVRAKVTDFGMARLGDINPQATRFTNTMCPGTDVYMPPEAVQDKPVYTEKIDCFSFGVITIQMLIQQFPKPGERLQEIELNHQGLLKRKLLMQIPEVERRQNHISQVDPNHSLLPIALDCLKDKDSERPSAHQLCERVADLKGMPKYINSIRSVQNKDEVIRSLTICTDKKNCIISSKEEENQQLRQQLQQERDQANRQLVKKERQLTLLNQQLESSEQVVAQVKREEQKTNGSSKGKELASFKLRYQWTEKKRAPFIMYRRFDAVVDGKMNTVYISNTLDDSDDKNETEIYSYDVITDIWSKLPKFTYPKASIAMINGWLTTIGGYIFPIRSNELFSLTGKGSDRRWVKKFPPMPTKRGDTTAVCTGTILIVAGGMGVGNRKVSTVEVMDTETHQWSTAADLPQPIYDASATVCGDQVYMLGGVNKDFIYTKSVYTCSVSALLQSCIQSAQSLERNVERTSLEDKVTVWKRAADLPVIRSTCESFHGRLLAVGGYISGKFTTAVYLYTSTTNSWEIIGHMKTGRGDCFTAVLPDNQLVVVGGVTDGGMSDTVEFADI